MTMTDRYIISQVRMIAAELVGLAVLTLIYWIVIANESGTRLDNITGRWEDGLQQVTMNLLPVFCLLLAVLIYRVYKKLYWKSLFGVSAVLYQSLPVSVSAAISGKIFLSGFCILLPGAIVVPPLGRVMVQDLFSIWYGLTDALIQILVNLGVERSMTLWVLALAAADLILACFSFSGAVLFALVHCQSKGGGFVHQVLELVILAGSVPVVIGAAILAVLSLGTGMMIPGLVFVLGYEGILLAAAGRKSVKLLERG